MTQAGSQTSHAAIIARSRGIPAVSGVPGILRHVNTGRHDRRRRTRWTRHGQSGRGEQRGLSQAGARVLSSQGRAGRQSRSTGGHRRRGGIEFPGQHQQRRRRAGSQGDGRRGDRPVSHGVSLPDPPRRPGRRGTAQTYRAIIAAAPQHQVTIRTLDIGGDKTVPYLGHHHKEANPFMGWRSIRLSFEHPEIFLTQLRAILRAAAFAAPSGARCGSCSR